MAKDTNEYVTKMREEYPMYEGVDDVTLAKAYRKKHYAEVDEGLFLEKVGIQEASFFDDAKEKVSSLFDSSPKQDVSIDASTDEFGVMQNSPTPPLQTKEKPTATITMQDEDVNYDPTIHGSDLVAPNIDGTMPKPIDTQSIQKPRNTNDTELMLFGDGEDYENPESADWELGKRLVNRTNELTANMIEGGYKALDFFTSSPLSALGLSTDDEKEFDKKKTEWFDKAAENLNDFVYEKNKMKINDDLQQKPTHSWDEVKKGFSKGGIFDADAWQELGNYVGSEGVVSLPDMAEMVAMMPLYYASRQQESAEKRAENEGRKKPVKQDYLMTAPTTIGSIMLDMFGLRGITSEVVENVGKKAIDGSVKDVAQTIAKEVKKGTVREGATEAFQNPLEKFGEEIATSKGLSSFEEYADDALAGFVAGGGMGAGMSGATATGAQAFNQYTKEKREAQHEGYVQEAYNKQMMSNGIVLETSVDSDGLIEFQTELDTKVKKIQDEFTNLTINHPEHSIPVEAIDNIDIQEQVVEQAKDNGLDVSNNNGLNAIDVGYQELKNELFGNSEQLESVDAIEPKGIEIAEQEQTQDTKPIQEDLTRLRELQEKTTPAQDVLTSNADSLVYFKNVAFDGKISSKSKRGTLVDLPFGLKGVVLENNDVNKTRNIYEYTTGLKIASSYSDKDNQEVIRRAKEILNDKGEEFITNMISSSQVVNDKIRYVKKEKEVDKNATKKGQVEFEFMNGTEIELKNGYPVNLADKIEALVFQKDNKNWGVVEKSSGVFLVNNASSRKEAIGKANELISKHKEHIKTEILKQAKNKEKIKFSSEAKEAYEMLSDAEKYVLWRSSLTKSIDDEVAQKLADTTLNDMKDYEVGTIVEEYIKNNYSFDSFKNSDIIKQDTQGASNDTERSTQRDTQPNVSSISNGNGEGEYTGVQSSDVGGTDSTSPKQSSTQAEATTNKLSDTDDGTANQERIPTQRSQRDSNTRRDTQVQVDENFEIDYEIGTGGLKSKFKDNLKAIEIVTKIQVQGYKPTVEDKKALSRYVGWGGLANAFVKPDGSVAKGWEKEAQQLQDLLSDEQYAEARRSTQDAHYTSKEVVNAIWDGVKQLGFKGGKVLEPSVGVGNFFGMMPSSLKNSTKLYGVELDSITATIATALYPKANIQNSGFQDVVLENGTYSLVIGNPPFGSQKLFDKNYKHLNDLSIHNYFFAKSMDSLEEGGILAMVVSNGLMDAGNSKAREYLGSQANLIGAIRLPNNAFSKNANTEVTTDIIFLQKRYKDQESNLDEWMDISEINDTPLNKYFANNKNMLLGEWGKFGSMYRGDSPALIPFVDKAASELLPDALASLPKNIVTHESVAKEDTTSAKFDGDVSKVRIGAMFVQDGNIFQRDIDKDGEAQIREIVARMNSKEKEVALTPKELERIKGMIEVVSTADVLRKLQLDNKASEAELNKARAELNKIYDTFVKNFGYLNNATNVRLFNEDVRSPFLLALEKNYDKGISAAVAKRTGELVKKESAEKADIFKKRTQEPYSRPSKAKNAQDALTISLSEFGAIRFDYMQDLIGKSEEQIIQELDGFIFEDINDGWVTREEYLSGNVKEKYKQAKDDAHKKALKNVIPKDIEAVDISVTLGSGWIPASDMADFVAHITGDDNPTAAYSKYNAKWSINAKVKSSNATRWGTDKRSASEILQQTMNLATMEVKNNHGTAHQPQWVVDTDATTAVQEKQEQLKAEFKDWIWKSADRRERLGALYNENFNNKALREFDGSHIKFTGKSNTIDLRQHQKNGVWRVLQGGKTLFDHTVGTGKTYTAIASVMELRRTGKAKKPLIVVPNHLTAQWGKEWMELYPSANILVPTKADFAAKRRKVLMSKIATGDYDGIIIAHSQLGSIQNDVEFEKKFLDDEIKRIQQSIDELKALDGKSRSVKDAEKSKDRLKDKLAKLNDRKRDDNLDFSELGIDALVVDEAHEFKNLTYTTGLQKVAGLGNPQGSKKAFDLFIKAQNLLEKTGGNNLVFLTGTPISNTIAEMFTMQRYLSYDKLKEQNLDVFDAWAKQYAEIISDWELSPSGKYKLNTRLKKFNNMPELITEYKMFADVVTREDIPSLPIPKIKSGRAQNIVVERSDAQAQYIGVEDLSGKYPKGSLVYRSENMPKGKPKKGDDNMLKIMGEARKVALDMRLIDSSYPDNPDSKVNLTVKNTLELYKRWNVKKGTQLIFCDLSTPKGAVAKEKARIQSLIKKADEQIDEDDNKAVEERDKAAEELAAMNPDDLDALNGDFSVYDDIKAKLLLGGMKESEIAFIHDASTDKQKEELFGKVKSGRVRVLLGSTSKMGAGMNVQNKLVALHHIDVPWRPSDLEQREGRIVRQGNEFFEADPKGFEVEIFRYATKNTLDSMMWQTIEAKANFIEQLRAGNLLDREVEDVSGEAVNAAEMKAMSSGNPLILEDMKIRKDVKKLEALKKSHDRSQYELEAKIKSAKSVIEQSKETLDAYAIDEKIALTLPKKFEMKIGNKTFDNREEAGETILSIINKMESDTSSVIGEIGGFKLYGEKSNKGLSLYESASVIISGKQDYEVTFNLGEQVAGGLTTKIINTIGKIPTEYQGYQMTLEETIQELPNLEAEIKEFKSLSELDALRTRQKEVLAQLRKKDDGKKQSSNVDELSTEETLEMTDELEGRSFMKVPTPKEQVQIDKTNSYARVNGYDEAGVNYVATYGVSGMPSRPRDGVITLGKKEIILPTIDKPMNADTVRVYLSDIVGNRLYEAKLRNKSALGVYKRNDSSIRLKSYSDVEIMAHEMAHYLDFFHNNKTRKAEGSFFRKEILKNKVEVKALSYTTKPKEVLSEGFAEFVRLWLTNYNALTLVAPNMIKDFEAKLAKDKSLQTKMLLLQEGMHQFYYQGSGTRLRGKQGGEINSIAKKINRSQKEILKDMRQSAIDKIHSIKRIEAEIRGDIAPDAVDSPYKTLQLAEHASSIVHTAMHFGVPTVNNNGDLSYSGKSLNAIFEPAAKVSEERLKLFSDYLVAKRASELMEQGRENLITRDEIDAGLELANTYPEFETMFEEYQEFNNGMLDFYVDMNHITPSQRENFLEMNKNYVPFHRIVESVQDGKVPPAKIGQRLTGGTHSLGNIMENIISSLETNIKQAMVSRGKSVFYKMLDDSGMGGVFATKIGADNKLVKSDVAQQAKKVAQLMAELGITVADDGMILSGSIEAEIKIDVAEIELNLLANPSSLEFWTHGHKPTSQTGYIDTVIIDGKKVYFEVHDAGLVDAITSFGNTNYGAFLQSIMSIKNIMTWNITNNPLFYLTNFARDTVSATALSKNNFKPVLSSMSGMYHFITKSKTYKEFMASGGGYGTRRTTLGGDVDAMAMLEVNRGFEVLNKVLSGMAYGADMFEYGTRIGDFALSQKAGKSNMQSAFDGNEVSTDFTIKGSNTTITGFMATVPFMKAAINGMDKTARRIFTLSGEMKFSNAVKFRNQLGELKKEKMKLYYMGSILAGATLALWFQNKDDERYKNLTRDQKLLNWYFFIDGLDKPIKIPRPYDIGFVFTGIPEIVADGIYSKHGKDAAKDFMWGVKTMFSIGDVSGVLQPILDDMTNTNWTGGPIVPSYLENIDDKGDQYLNSTPLIYKEIGKATGVSPIKMQHYIGGYLGLTAKMVEEATEKLLWNNKEWGERAFDKNALEFMTYRFKGREVEPRTKYSEKYYELANKAKGVKASFDAKKRKAYVDKGQGIKEYMTEKEKAAYLSVNKQLGRYNSVLVDIKNGVEFIQYDKTKTKAQKEKAINELYTKRNDMLEKISTTLESKLKELEGK